MENFTQILEILKNTNLPIYIAGHINPDYDSISSSLSLARLLEKLNKNAHVLLQSPSEDIVSTLHNAYLIANKIQHKDYIFVALDLNETYRLGIFEQDYFNAKTTINIDHHQGNHTNADYIVSNSKVSSTCELIYNLICELNKDYLDLEINECLYAGIMTDTGCFSRRVFNKTLNIAQELINSGVNYERLIREAYSKRSVYELKALSILVNDLKFDKFHYVIMDRTLDCFKDLTHNEIVKTIAEEIRHIVGIDVFLMIIKEENSITTKCMSNISKNADKIAELFGGGGHKGEAGFTTNKYSIDDIIQKTKLFLEKNSI